MSCARILQATLVISLFSEMMVCASSLHKKETDYHENRSSVREGQQLQKEFHDSVDLHFLYWRFKRKSQQEKVKNLRRKKVLNLFPVMNDGECLSDDGRRYGMCLNVYECRKKGGKSRGECDLGFGVCCVFLVQCEQQVKNNGTYIVSPHFPSLGPRNITSCNVKVHLINEDISQLRIDFIHFSLGQPNRKTGVCDGDVFKISGGLAGDFKLCGQNSGQHVYYDIVNSRRKSTQEANAFASNGQSTSIPSDSVDILMSFTNSSLVSSRLWEIRVSQIPFSQRAPAGCMQYYTGSKGIIRTFNFADNGRHLANQNYKACLRQESNMCSVVYEPCDEQSFRIGPHLEIINKTMPQVNASSSVSTEATLTQPTGDLEQAENQSENYSSFESSIEKFSTTERTFMETTVPAAYVEMDDSDSFEGSGGGDANEVVPVRGGFDLYAFFRNNFGYERLEARVPRQAFPVCTDRITIPCIIEDFLEGSFGLPLGCEPVHCGHKFCSASNGPCRVETTVIPFRVGIHFGEGNGKGNAEDNIGMCLKYTQVECL